jgi:hypothetical protein
MRVGLYQLNGILNCHIQQVERERVVPRRRRRKEEKKFPTNIPLSFSPAPSIRFNRLAKKSRRHQPDSSLAKYSSRLVSFLIRA